VLKVAWSGPIEERVMSTRMEFRILGPLEVWNGEHRLTLGSPRQRALLGSLLLHPDEEVATDRLAAALWGDTPPEQTASALRAHVAAIRRLLEPEREKGAPSMLVSGTNGYRLSVDPEQVDLCRFERLVEQGRLAMDSDPVTCSSLLHRAASLWRGPALGDLTLAGDAAAECARLDELRMAAVEDRIHADLELGRHAAVVPELEALVAAHPLRERLHAQRMLALHRCGRQADALAAYGEAQRHLDPSPDLQSLERAIVEDDPALAAPAPAPANTVIGSLAPFAETPLRPVLAIAQAPDTVTDPRPAVRRARPRRTMAGAIALTVAGSALGGIAFHSLRASAQPQSLAPDAFPNPQEQLLLDRFAPVVSDCHRYAQHYARALAEIQCRVRADHRGASTLLLQSFAGYDDLEMHFHHVLGLTIQSETGRPATAAYHGDCADPGSGFFALANHQRQGATTANGHLMCYVDHAGVPRLAWTDVSRLTVAQAVGGPGAPAETQAGLLSFWRSLYPGETVATTAQLTAQHVDTPPTPAAVVPEVAPEVAPATQATTVSRTQLAPTPSPTPASAPATGARSRTAGGAAAAPAPAGGHPATGGDGHNGGWDEAWHKFFDHGHD
jgi:DNA-binding SARP family transcriptional activator